MAAAFARQSNLLIPGCLVMLAPLILIPFAVWVEALAGKLSPQAATAELANILAEAATCVTARLYRAKLLKRENKMDEARKEFERVLDEDPDNKDAQNELKLILLTVRR